MHVWLQKVSKAAYRTFMELYWLKKKFKGKHLMQEVNFPAVEKLGLLSTLWKPDSDLMIH